MNAERGNPHGRRSDRVHLALEIQYRSAGAFLMSYSVNLSKGGLFIETENPLPVGAPIDLALKTPNEETIALSGVVAWVRSTHDPESGQPPGMGIQVHTPEERYGAMVDRIASRFDGIKILLALGPGPARHRAMLHRLLGAVLTCTVIDIEDPFYSQDDSSFDLAVISVDWVQGEQVLARLRDGQSQVPVIALGRAAGTRDRATELGAAAVLENPPVFPDLRAAVIACLARPASVSA
jgi:uncharacterized protein (TIGR02266 family)